MFKEHSTRTKLRLEFRFSTFEKLLCLQKTGIFICTGSWNRPWILLLSLNLQSQLDYVLELDYVLCTQVLCTWVTSYVTAFVKLITKLLFQSPESFIIPKRFGPFYLDLTPALIFFHYNEKALPPTGLWRHCCYSLRKRILNL